MRADLLYSNSRNSSTVKPACFKMSPRVPLASVLCMGTTVRKTLSPARFSSDTWLPLCRNSTKPAFFRARTTRSPETLGSLVISFRDFYDSPKRCLAAGRRFRHAPSFEIQLDGLAEVGSSRLHIFPLRRNAKLRATSNVPLVFFGYESGKAIVHEQNRIRLTAREQGSNPFELQETPSPSSNKLLRGKND
jgi:hypothetical protein